MRHNREAAAAAVAEYERDRAAVLGDAGEVLYVLNEGRPEPADEDACEVCGDVLHGVTVITDDKRQLCGPCAMQEGLDEDEADEADRCRFCGRVVAGSAGECATCGGGL